MPKPPRAHDPLVCLCNEVPLSAIEAAIRGGASTLAQVFDATFAGCGPCGGSCQEQIAQLLRDRAPRPPAPPPPRT